MAGLELEKSRKSLKTSNKRNRISLIHKIAVIMKNEKTTALGAAFGVAIGSVIGVLTDNLGLWISLGIAVGAGIGILSKRARP